MEEARISRVLPRIWLVHTNHAKRSSNCGSLKEEKIVFVTEDGKTRFSSWSVRFALAFKKIRRLLSLPLRAVFPYPGGKVQSRGYRIEYTDG